jgi:hypothetical protein
MMKRTLFFMFALTGLMASGQISNTGFGGVKVPIYMASTKGGSYAVPVVFRAHVQGLQPNKAYKYITRGIIASDFTSTAVYPGAGSPIFLDSGNWKTTTTPSWTNASGHDTFWTNGAGEYEGWFGFIPTSDARFNPGKNVYPCILAKGIYSSDSLKTYGMDSMHVTAFGAGKSSDSCTGIWGKCMANPKNFVALYDNTSGNGRPLSITMIEKDEITIPGAVSYYSSNVDGTNNRWGTIIPNNNANGVQRIENLDRYNGLPMYANTDADGKWGPSNKNTINPNGGRTNPIALDENDAALISPMVEFWTRTSTTTEGVGIKEVYVVRKYSNNTPQTVRLSVVGGTATKGAGGDYTITEPKTITFNPGAQANDTTKITIIDDNIAESAEDVVLKLDQPGNCILGVEVAHTLTINDNDVANFSFGSTKIIAKETDGTVSMKIKMNMAVSSPSTLRLLVKSKGDSSLIPGEFKLGKSYTDSVFTLGKSSGPDSVTIKGIIIDDLNGDWDDTFNMAIRVKSGLAKASKDSLCTIIVKDNDGPAYIKFVGTSITVSEKVGSVKLKIKVISKTDAGGDFTLRFIPSGSSATQTQDFTWSPTSQIINIDATTPDTISISVPIVDDQIYEPLENALFNLGILSNVKIQKPDSFNIYIVNDDLPVYSLNTITKQNKAGKVADSLNVKCRVYGTVHGGNMLSGTGVQFTIMDKTSGLAILSPIKNYGYTVKEGDSVMVQGKIDQILGAVTMTTLDTIIRIATNRTLRTPNTANDVDETTENKMTKFNRVILVNSAQWPSSALAANTTAVVAVKHTDGTADTLIIDAETNIDGTAAPTGYINVTGIGTQSDPTNPFSGLYALVPRYLTDIETATLPTVNFKHIRDTIWETADSLNNIAFSVLPLDENFKFDVAVKSTTTAVSPTDYNFTTRTVSVIKNNSVAPFKCNISDDLVSDGNKYLVFVIRNIVGPGRIGPDSTLTVLIKDDEASSVKNFAGGNIRMYPNPAQGKVWIDSKTPILKAELLAIDGRILWTGEQKSQFEIPLNFASGMYQVRITDAQGQIYSEPLMIK